MLVKSSHQPESTTTTTRAAHSPFFILDLGLDVVDSVGRFDLQGDRLAREGLDKNLHLKQGRLGRGRLWTNGLAHCGLWCCSPCVLEWSVRVGTCRSGAVQLIKSWLSLGQVRMTCDEISFLSLLQTTSKVSNPLPPRNFG